MTMDRILPESPAALRPLRAKLDEIIRSLADARSQFIGIEHHTDREIQGIRQSLEEECGEDGKDGKPAPKESVDRLIKRT